MTKCNWEHSLNIVHKGKLSFLQSKHTTFNCCYSVDFNQDEERLYIIWVLMLKGICFVQIQISAKKKNVRSKNNIRPANLQDNKQ